MFHKLELLIRRLNFLTSFTKKTIKKKKVKAYLNQKGFIKYKDNKQCLYGHATSHKNFNKTDECFWCCSTKGCQKSVSIRAGTFLTLLLNF